MSLPVLFLCSSGDPSCTAITVGLNDAHAVRLQPANQSGQHSRRLGSVHRAHSVVDIHGASQAMDQRKALADLKASLTKTNVSTFV